MDICRAGGQQRPEELRTPRGVGSNFFCRANSLGLMDCQVSRDPQIHQSRADSDEIDASVFPEFEMVEPDFSAAERVQ